MRLLLLAALTACSDKTSPPDDSTVTADDSATDDSATDDSASDDSGDDTGAPGEPGVLMLAGGGSEGERDDETAWSWALYQGLLAGGDVNGDGLVKVAVLSDEEETEWIPEYFVRLGADAAYNVTIDSRQTAQSNRTVQQIAGADAVFIKGGDQGIYYDLWNDTATEDAIVALWQSGGGVGGTSAGAMSQAEYCLSGSADYVSADVLADSHTVYLDDVGTPGTSGIHTDFLSLLPNATVDTHFTERGRLGRMLGVMARAIDEGAPQTLWGIGLEQQTGILVTGTSARVYGVGTVSLVRADTAPLREDGLGLVWTDLQLDVLTDGASFELETGLIDPGPDAEAVESRLVPGAAPTGWSVSGQSQPDAERFGWVVERAPFALRPGTDDLQLPGAFGLLDAYNAETRGEDQELCLRGLYEAPGALCVLVGGTGRLVTNAGLVGSEAEGSPELSSLLLDSSAVSARALSPWPSPYDAGDGSLHAAGLIGLRLHVIARSDNLGLWYDPQAREIHAN